MAILVILVSSLLLLAALPTPTRSHGSDEPRITPPGPSRDADASMYIVRLHSAPPLAAYRGEIAGYPAIVPTNSGDDPRADGEDDTWATLQRPAVGAITGSENSRSEAGSRSGNPTLETPSSLKAATLGSSAAGGARMSMRAPHVRAYAELLARMQAEVASEVGIAADNIAYSYKHVTNGFAALLSPAQLHRLARHPAVASARPSRPLRPDTIDSPAFLGLAGRAGAQNRANRGSEGTWRALGGQRRAGEGMVVGAAAGNSGVPMAGGRASGMAPAARLAAYKVFWYSQGDRPEMRALGGESADLLAAVNQAVADGVHVLSISLSADDPEATYFDDVAYMNANLAVADGVHVMSISLSADDPDATYFDDVAYMNANLAGVTVVMSAGNNGAPLSNPLGTYRTIANFSPFYLTVGASSIIRGGVSLASSPASDGEYGSSEAESDNQQEAETHLSTAAAATTVGKNSTDTSSSSTTTTTTTESRHAPSITAALPSATAAAPAAPVVAAFSSSGPLHRPWSRPPPGHASNSLLKPDIIGPGVDLWAAWVGTEPGKAGGRGRRGGEASQLSGTSMATPHLAGIAALIMQKHPTWSPPQAVAALSFSTAVKGAALSTRNLVAAAPIVPRGLGVSALLNFSNSAAPAKNVPVKKQLRTEDGIFGTSGGFGFTKANELFVGRVAMLGFAASLLGEAVTGQGILSQLNLETGIPITEAEPLLLFFIAFTVLGAIGGLGDRGRFVDDEPAGPLVNPGSFKSALGLSEDGPLFGFTKANELFVGRMAQLGFAASLIGEVVTGRGALAQLNIETGLPVWELEPLLLASIAFFFVAAINPGTGKFINDEE
ncbi:unnamed protein product [Closterium sp. Naga37s-1]|nr:unnamed protein product [Closterium sp. Naga37s-1]